MVVVIDLLLVVTDNDDHVELRRDQRSMQPVQRCHRFRMTPGELFRSKLGLQ